LDIDCLDPAFAPGTGTPEIGGLSTRQVFTSFSSYSPFSLTDTSLPALSLSQVMTILEELSPKLNFVGMDCVEVAPPYDQTELTSQAAAGFVWTYVCGRIFATKK
jgi:agmatinase